MRESYRENLASHSGHEPYAGSSDVPGVAWEIQDPRENDVDFRCKQLPRQTVSLSCYRIFIKGAGSAVGDSI
jgi:hypothetical protein